MARSSDEDKTFFFHIPATLSRTSVGVGPAILIAMFPKRVEDGERKVSKGKGICSGGTCQFLIAVPVKTFDSGDSNRDLHMLPVTRGAQYPMVSVRTQIPESAITTGTVRADLSIEFAGQTITVDAVLSSVLQPAQTESDDASGQLRSLTCLSPWPG